jgi:hypothetical protein
MGQARSSLRIRPRRSKLIACRGHVRRKTKEVQLGRNLAAAFIATCHGIGLDYARKKYAAQPVGQYWIALARKIARDMSMRAVEPERTSAIQRARPNGQKAAEGAMRELTPRC